MVINTGKLKINKTGENISSAQSVASMTRATQEQKIREGKAHVLDTSYVSHATEKEQLDQTFVSSGTMMTHKTSQSQAQSQSSSHRISG